MISPSTDGALRADVKCCKQFSLVVLLGGATIERASAVHETHSFVTEDKNIFLIW